MSTGQRMGEKRMLQTGSWCLVQGVHLNRGMVGSIIWCDENLCGSSLCYITILQLTTPLCIIGLGLTSPFFWALTVVCFHVCLATLFQRTVHLFSNKVTWLNFGKESPCPSWLGPQLIKVDN